MKGVSLCLLAFSFFLLFACSKCDEVAPGPCKDCYEKLAGSWTLHYFATNGKDSVDYYDSIFTTHAIITFQFYDKHADHPPEFAIHWGDTSGFYYFTGGTYDGIDKESNLQVQLVAQPNSNVENPFINWNDHLGDTNWKIDKLSNADLWLSFTNNGNIYEMQLNR